MSLPKTAMIKRHRRRIILPNHWINISSRTIRGQFWFSAFTKKDNARVMGLLIAAMKRYGVKVAAFVLFSNHFHLLARTRRSGKRISLLVQYLKAGIARLVHEKHGTRGAIWDGPFHATNLLDDEAEWNALVYICQHGPKERIVASAELWPLANTAHALRQGIEITGLFPDRADPSVLRPVRAELTPLSRWRSNRVGYKAQCVEMLNRITATAIADGVGRSPVGRVVDHSHVPESVKLSGYTRTFNAAGELAAELTAEAYTARRAGIDAAVIAAQTLVHRGCDGLELPEQCQWPPFVSEALGEAIAECTFAEVYAPGPPAG
jgi:REP element-mobilizing transposase RayT